VAALICAPAPPARTRRRTIYGWSTRRTDAVDLDAIGVSHNREGGKASIYPDKSSVLVLRSMLMAPPRMVVRSLDVQAHIPTVDSLRDGRG
jgi:hypothetical protein